LQDSGSLGSLPPCEESLMSSEKTTSVVVSFVSLTHEIIAQMAKAKKFFKCEDEFISY